MNTPGEWIADKPAKVGKHWKVMARGKLGGKIRRGLTGAECLWHLATVANGAPGDTLETEAANARLFAASKELLAACKLALPNLVNEEAANAVRAAIEKAASQ